MPYETTGSDFPVVRPDLTQVADIENAFNLFYEGVLGDPNYPGVEDYITDLNGRLTVLEGSNPASGTFDMDEFRIGNNGSPVRYLYFGLAGLTADRTLTVPDASDTIVLLATAQSLTNKTLSGASNVIYVRDSNFRIQETDSDYVTFDAALVSGAQTAGFRDYSGTKYIVFEDLAQTLTSKTLNGYKEDVYTASVSSGNAAIDADAYNSAEITLTGTTSSVNITVNNLHATKGHAVLIVIKNSTSNQRTVTINGTIKWSGGTSLSTVSASKTALIAVSKVNGVIYGTYLGEYY